MRHVEGDLESHSRWNVLLLYAVAVLATTSNGAVAIAFPLYLGHLGHPLPLIGATVALMGIGALVSRLPSGAWYRLSYARVLTAVTSLLSALTAVAMAFTDDWSLLATLVTINGFTFGMASTFTMALLIELRPRNQGAGPAMAWYTAALSTGYALSAPTGTFPIEWHSHAAAFILAGSIGVVGAVLTLALRTPRARAVQRPAAAQSAESAAREVRPSSRLAWITALPAAVWLATLLGFYINFVSDVYNTFFPLYALSIGISLSSVGIWKALHSGAATGIRFAAAAILHYANVGVVNHLGVVTMAVALVGLSVFTNEFLLAGSFIVLGMSRGLVRVTSATVIAEVRPRPGVVPAGMASGLYNAGLDAGTVLGPPIAGLIAGFLDIPMTFRVVAVVLPALYYGVWFWQRSRERRRESVVARDATLDEAIGPETERARQR